jgi:hypothetical protein
MAPLPRFAMPKFSVWAWIAQLVEHFPEEEGVPGSSPGPSTDMWHALFSWTQKYERHISALAMIGGFVVDNLVFKRVDLIETQLLFAFYAGVCFFSIPLLHSIESRQVFENTPRSGLRLVLPFFIQFALGGFWSGFVIFYSRSADFGTSWPFLLLIVAVFLGSEYFNRYHARLVFTSTLFFLAVYLGAIFIVPIYTHTIGTLTFIGSGLVAILIFILFTMLLRFVAHDRFYKDVWRIRVGAFVVLVLMNVFYFTSVLPPLPLSAAATGIYHDVWRIPGEYLALRETKQPLVVRYFGFAPTLHITAGEWIAAYSSIFAPTALSTVIVHRWQRYDTMADAWVTMSTISYPIIGGRDDGYRGYSTTPIFKEGKWRVSIETSDGRAISRLPFAVELVDEEYPTETVTLD